MYSSKEGYGCLSGSYVGITVHPDLSYLTVSNTVG